MKKIAIIGATGAVGKEILSLLEERNFPVASLLLFASPRSLGTSVFFKKEKIPLEILQENSLKDLDLSFFCAGGNLSREWIPKAEGFVIDSSSALRDKVPLVIPEINAHALKAHQRIVSSPNCATTILALPLYPLHQKYRVKRVIASTYQAASGAGAHLLEELQRETRAHLEGVSYQHHLPFPYAFNLYPHNSPLHPSGYVEEERKMLFETRKIFEDDAIQISATCVRVPVLRAHSIAVNVEFHHPFSLPDVYAAWKNFPGLQIFEDPATNRFPTPRDAEGKDAIFCGRGRVDPSQPNTLEFWAVGDQLRKGAALNAVQIAELFLNA